MKPFDAEIIRDKFDQVGLLEPARMSLPPPAGRGGARDAVRRQRHRARHPARGCWKPIPASASSHQAADGRAALDALAGARGRDVVLLDLEMPVMDGMTALPLILKAAPRPAVIVASALTQRGADGGDRGAGAPARPTTCRSRRAPPAARPTRPSGRADRQGARLGADEAAEQARAARAPPRRRAPRAAPRAGRGLRPALVAIGCSTGGPQALATLVEAPAARCRCRSWWCSTCRPASPPCWPNTSTGWAGIACAEAEDGEALLAGPHLPGAGRPAPAGRSRAGGLRRALDHAARRRISAAPRSTRCCAARSRALRRAACWR